jgi:uncharacterized protein (TIGR04255 family)
MGKLYEQSPILEALCEFRFQPGQLWDWTIPGLIYDRVRTDFPKKRQRNVLEVEMRAEQQEMAQNIKGPVTRMQFLRQDEKALLQVGPDLLVVNKVAPYSNWKTFKTMIASGLAVYRDVAQPTGLKRIGLRYINRIELSETSIALDDYILATPGVPDSMPGRFAAWAQRVEIPFEGTNGMLVLQSGSATGSSQSKLMFILDFDFFTLRAETITLDSAIDWVEQAHNQIEAAFETCITDKTRVLFKEINHVE